MSKNTKGNLDFFYEAGLTCLVCGLLHSTVTPELFHWFLYFPDRYLFTVPTSILFMLTLTFWAFSKNTEHLQYRVTGKSLIFYGIFLVFTDYFILRKIYVHNIIESIIIIIIGILCIYIFYYNNKKISYQLKLVLAIICTLLSVINILLYFYIPKT